MTLRTAAKEAILTLFILLIVLVCAEGLMRWVTSHITIYDIEMLKYARDLKQRSPIPGISHIHRPNSAARLMDVDITLNNLGHRSRELPAEKAPNEVRIHLIGSSMALGWGVQENDLFLHKAVEKLNARPGESRHFNYINAGVGNYNAVSSAVLLENQIDQTRPDMVILQYYINDAEPNPVGNYNKIWQHSLFAAFMFQRMLYLTSTGTQTLAQFYGKMYDEDGEGWKRTLDAINKVRDLCTKRNISLHAVMIPEMHDLTNKNPYIPIYDKINKMFKLAKIELHSFFPGQQAIFEKNHEQLWVAKDDPHPNAIAHQKMADEIYDLLNAKYFPLK